MEHPASASAPNGKASHEVAHVHTHTVQLWDVGGIHGQFQHYFLTVPQFLK